MIAAGAGNASTKNLAWGSVGRPRSPKEEIPVISSRSLILALGLVAIVAAPSARADEPKFFFETQPAFDNCGDGSLARAQKDGITLGVSQIPPEEIVDEKTKQ